MRIAAPLLFLALAACATSPSMPGARLPDDAVNGIGDPTRAAIIGSAFTLNGPLTPTPPAAARALAAVEYLAGEIPSGPRWVEFPPVVGLELLAARAELRAALGVAPDASPQAVVDGLYAAGRALAAGDRGAAATALPGAFADRQLVLARLERLPPLPRARFATALAEGALRRMDMDGQLGGTGGGDGRGN